MNNTAEKVVIGKTSFKVHLKDGRQIKVSFSAFPRLHKATDEQRRNFEISAKGMGIHWPEIDEDISVNGLLRAC